MMKHGFIQSLLNKSRTKPAMNLEQQPQSQNPNLQELYPSLEQNQAMLSSIYANCSDVVFRPFLIGHHTNAILVYIEGLSDSAGIEEYVFTPLLREELGEHSDILKAVVQRLAVTQVKEFNTLSKCIEYLSNGFPILLMDHETRGLALGLTKWEKRSIEEPSAEAGIRGPREGFTETLRINTSQIRRIIKSPQLKMESVSIGEYTQTHIVVAYIEGIADLNVVKTIKHRIQRIKIDGILESGYIQELLQEYPYTPFPQMLNTERPDVTCANLLEGRIAIITEGTPFVLIAPITFFSIMQSQEDYYQGYLIGTVTRWMRYVFTFFSLFLPSLYVAILSFHQEMIPGFLLFSMASSREAIPFPALIEALIMEVFFEALREAGVRLPKQIGAAVSIVGALVIGQAAVQAGLISAPMVIVVAIGGISSFMIPRYSTGIAIRMLRFPMMILAGTLGFLGVMLGFIAITLHLLHLHSFGVPYLASVSVPRLRELGDTLIRSPLWMMDTRPQLTTEGSNPNRQASQQKPVPGREDKG